MYNSKPSSQQTAATERVTDPAEQLRLLTAPRAHIRLELLAHEGTFGRLYKGVYKKGDTYEEVIVKTVSGNFDTNNSCSVEFAQHKCDHSLFCELLQLLAPVAKMKNKSQLLTSSGFL